MPDYPYGGGASDFARRYLRCYAEPDPSSQDPHFTAHSDTVASYQMQGDAPTLDAWVSSEMFRKEVLRSTEGPDGSPDVETL